MMEAGLTATLDGRIWSIGIDRPNKRNALDEILFDALANALSLAQADPRIHCVLLRGTAECFCSGHDTTRFDALWPQPDNGVVVRCIDAFLNLSKPLLAAVRGPAVGFGATLLLHADWIVAGESATFRFPFTALGIVPEAGATALLARRVGDLAARDWLMSGRPVSSREALQRGLVSSVRPDADVLAAANDYAASLAAKPLDALMTTRRLLLEGATLNARQAVASELAQLNRLIPTLNRSSTSHG
jgi:enoyl-CoA hydratase/carnithine racemase